VGYVHNRNYGCRVSDEYTFRGLRLVVLENEKLRVTVLVDKGTDIYEFLKPLDVDFLWHSPTVLHQPGLFVPSSPPGKGAFLDYYEGGWQEMLPNSALWPLKGLQVLWRSTRSAK